MTKVTTNKAREDLPALLKRVSEEGERIVIQNKGKAIAVLVSVEDFALLEKIEKLEDEQDLKDAREAVKKNAGKKGIPLSKIREKLGL